MRHLCGGVFALLLLTASPALAANYAVKLAQTPPPSSLKEPFRKLLGDQSVQFLDDKGTVLAEVWFRKEIPAKATAEQVKNGLTYREIEETTFLGAVRFDQPFTDYRKQKIKTGVYTLRLGYQPMDGDHMGTAPYPDFCLLIPAAADPKPDTMDVKEMRELSNKAPAGNHPGVMLLYPADKPPETPQVQAREGGVFVVVLKGTAVAGGQKAPLGIALTLVGHTAAE
jgi:hypothetical protein